MNLRPGSLKRSVEGDDELLLVAGDYSKALSSKRRGSLELTDTKTELVIDLG